MIPMNVFSLCKFYGISYYYFIYSGIRFDITRVEKLANLKDKLLEMMNDRGKIASCLLSRLSKITNSEHTRQFELVKDPNSNRANDL